jgi:hypothetical protein
MRGIVWTMSVALAATVARAQPGNVDEPRDPPPLQEDAGTAGRLSEMPLADACVATLRGRLAPADVPNDLPDRCEQLIRQGAAASASVGGAGREPLPAGESVRAAFTQAGSELIGRGRGSRLGERRGLITSTLVTNPIGWFSGLGMNAEYARPVEAFPRLSWVIGARFSRTDATNGRVSAFGLGGGTDLFLIGGRNEGLRIGPRLELAFGTEDIQGRTTFGRVGASGELGYNFIASNGITALGAVGLGGRLAGDEQNDSFTSFTGGDFGAYVKLGLGYSW